MPAMTSTIAITRRLPPPVVDALAPHGRITMAANEAGLDRAGLIALLREADAALVTALDVIDAEVIAACPKLKLVANIGVGYDNIDVTAAQARGIAVTNTPGAMDDAVADLAVGLMLAAARRLPQADAFVRGGHWTPANTTGFGMGLDVSRKTLGIVGFGRIGQALARRARGFDMTVLYQARRPVDAATETALNARHCALDELLGQADFVVLLVPYSSATHHLIGAAQLSRMKRTAVLVNVARGGVVDDAALAAALEAGNIAGAALDCVENEPNVHPALRALPSVVFTPHIGSATQATRMKMAGMALHNLIAGLNGQTPPNLVTAAGGTQ
jgi:glyoxylate/hydroxypyruvate/2-ketogluconate reductase